MASYWWLIAGCLLIAFYYAMRFGTQFVEMRTGRTGQPEKASNRFDAVFFGFGFAISIPPIYLWPNTDPMVHSAFILLGILAGSLASQAIFGKKRT
jgi:hypothetical protein